MGEEFSGGDLDQGYQKRGRFEEGPGPGSGEELSVPPATLRVLVRQMDAGGIIGKVSVFCKVADAVLVQRNI